MNTLVEYLNGNTPDKAFIGLFASQGKNIILRKNMIFKDYSPNMTGMFTVISKKIGVINLIKQLKKLIFLRNQLFNELKRL